MPKTFSMTFNPNVGLSETQRQGLFDASFGRPGERFLGKKLPTGDIELYFSSKTPSLWERHVGKRVDRGDKALRQICAETAPAKSEAALHGEDGKIKSAEFATDIMQKKRNHAWRGNEVYVRLNGLRDLTVGASGHGAKSAHDHSEEEMEQVPLEREDMDRTEAAARGRKVTLTRAKSRRDRVNEKSMTRKALKAPELKPGIRSDDRKFNEEIRAFLKRFEPLLERPDLDDNSLRKVEAAFCEVCRKLPAVFAKRGKSMDSDTDGYIALIDDKIKAVWVKRYADRRGEMVALSAALQKELDDFSPTSDGAGLASAEARRAKMPAWLDDVEKDIDSFPLHGAPEAKRERFAARRNGNMMRDFHGIPNKDVMESIRSAAPSSGPTSGAEHSRV